MKKILDFLTEQPIFHIATIDGNQPRVRPFGFHMVDNGRLYFFTGQSKEIYRQLQANPRFEISAANTNRQWLRIRATAVFESRPDLVEKAFFMLPMLRDLYEPKGKSKPAIFYANDAEALLADFNGNQETIMF